MFSKYKIQGKKRKNHRFPNGFVWKGCTSKKEMEKLLEICAQKVWISRPKQGIGKKFEKAEKL